MKVSKKQKIRTGIRSRREKERGNDHLKLARKIKKEIKFVTMKNYNIRDKIDINIKMHS